MAAVSAAQDVGADVHSTECMLGFCNGDSSHPCAEVLQRGGLRG